MHEGIADGLIGIIRGAAQELVLGDPAELATDVGPVIDLTVKPLTTSSATCSISI